MRVTVQGIVTSVENRTRDEKNYTEILLAQKGEQQQVKVRLPGHVADRYSEFELAEFTGNLIAWKTRDGVGMMVNVNDGN